MAGRCSRGSWEYYGNEGSRRCSKSKLRCAQLFLCDFSLQVTKPWQTPMASGLTGWVTGKSSQGVTSTTLSHCSWCGSHCQGHMELVDSCMLLRFTYRSRKHRIASKHSMEVLSLMVCYVLHVQCFVLNSCRSWDDKRWSFWPSPSRISSKLPTSMPIHHMMLICRQDVRAQLEAQGVRVNDEQLSCSALCGSLFQDAQFMTMHHWAFGIGKFKPFHASSHVCYKREVDFMIILLPILLCLPYGNAFLLGQELALEWRALSTTECIAFQERLFQRCWIHIVEHPRLVLSAFLRVSLATLISA